MRKMILTACLAAVGTVNAQINKGTILFGGDLNVNQFNQQTKDTTVKFKNRSNGFVMSLGGGYFIAKNLTAGVNIGYIYGSGSNSYTGSYQNTEKSKDYSIAPYLRYY